MEATSDSGNTPDNGNNNGSNDAQKIQNTIDDLSEQLKSSSLPKAWQSEEGKRLSLISDKAIHAMPTISTEVHKVVQHDIMSGKKLLDRQAMGMGSGIVIDAANGLVITNYHVIEKGSHIKVSFENGLEHGAKVLAYDKTLDFAILEVPPLPSEIPSIPLGDSDAVELAQTVIAIGNPFGLERSVTKGIISSKSRELQLGPDRKVKMIQTDASINPGNSGGPLLDMDGRLIGMNTLIYSKSGSSAGLGFATPVNEIRKLLNHAVDKNLILSPRVGLDLLNTDLGPVVASVKPGSPADKAGIKGADIEDIKRGNLDKVNLIESVNGKKIRDIDEIREIISKSSVDNPITINIRIGINGPVKTFSLYPEMS